MRLPLADNQPGKSKVLDIADGATDSESLIAIIIASRLRRIARPPHEVLGAEAHKTAGRAQMWRLKFREKIVLITLDGEPVHTEWT